jgi:histidyl-tRNA synthetase
MASVTSINDEIIQQTALLNDLLKQKADASAIDEAKKILSDLKKSLGMLKAAGGVKDVSKKKDRLLLKTGKVSDPDHTFEP